MTRPRKKFDDRLHEQFSIRESFSLASSCGSNDSYSLSFNGPAFECHHGTFGGDNPENRTLTDALFINAGTVNKTFWLFFTLNNVPGLRDSGIETTQAVAFYTYNDVYDVNISFSNDRLTAVGEIERGLKLDCRAERLRI